MVKVAIAGGTSPTLGHSIIKAILATNGRHTPIILSRLKPDSNEPTPSTTLIANHPVETRHVDYHSQPTLTTALSDIHTVISVLLSPNPTDWANSQINLFHASISAGVKRFAPSEFALGTAMHHKAPMDAPKIVVWDAIQQAIRDSGSPIETTRFVCGGFMNYLGIGCPGNEQEALAGFRERPYLFNIRDGWVEVPLRDDGGYPRTTMTEIGDVGRFVAAALDLERWGRGEMAMVGEVVGFGEVVRVIEKVTGRTMRVKEVGREELRREIEGLQPADWVRRMECGYNLVYCDDVDGETALEGYLNKMCPQVKPVGIAEYLERYWGKGAEGGSTAPAAE
ncbi:hypothetical protein FQN53_001002 [Emmonsiellopsis sp. PD_33]|nr:hypothetical protein FQN53_001002 [Emmonsiellopsis sp. PD_33]